MNEHSSPLEVISGDRAIAVIDPARSDPFRQPHTLMERYFYGAHHDAIQSCIGLLFIGGAWRKPEIGNVGLMVCRDVFELGWKIGEQGRPPAEHWWIVVGSGFIELEQLPRVELPPPPPPTDWQVAMHEQMMRQIQPAPDEPAPIVMRTAGVSYSTAGSYWPTAARFRYQLLLFPDAMVVIGFDSASYYIGEQDVPSVTEAFDPLRRFDWPTQWMGACHWP